ncbi:MAG: glycosyltransferase family 39 protein [Treponema sp.]|jgi:hypothetical protein|nr:glycosyltransferase family 39 protein [Treponema sp.]
MTNRSLGWLKNRLDISGKALFCLAVFAGGILLLLTPVFQSFLVALGELFLRRPLNHPHWHKRILQWGISGIIFYGVFFLVFFAKNLFREARPGGRLYLFLAAFIALGVFAIMFRANWVFGDDHIFIRSTAVNNYLTFPSYLSGGRFYPFGHIHYNIPLFTFRLLGINSGLPPAAHYAVIALFFAVTVICLYALFDNIVEKETGANPLFALLFACGFFMTGRAFINVFMSIIYPDTQVIALFAVFMLAYYRARETDKKRYYIAALISAVYASYCKEPVFGALLVIAASNYIFNFKGLSKREKIFHAALVLNGVLFTFLYYFLSYRNAAGFYNEGRVEVGAFRFVVSVFAENPVLIVMYVFGIARLLAVLLKKDRARMFHDTLLFAGMAYVFAYILLRLNADYYFMPAIILFLPSLVFWIGALYQKNRNLALAVFCLLLIFSMFNGRKAAADIAGKYQDRKEFTPYIGRLLTEYRDGKRFIWYESDNAPSDNTFYIAVRNWKKRVENAFLNFQNKSEGKEFFTVSKDIAAIDFNANLVFFYPDANDQYQPMPDSLSNLLRDNGFELVTDAYGVLIYRK